MCGQPYIAPGDLFNDHIVNSPTDPQPAEILGPRGALHTDLHQSLMDFFKCFFCQNRIAVPPALQILAPGHDFSIHIFTDRVDNPQIRVRYIHCTKVLLSKVSKRSHGILLVNRDFI